MSTAKKEQENALMSESCTKKEENDFQAGRR
jgi:hypothetical protein